MLRKKSDRWAKHCRVSTAAAVFQSKSDHCRSGRLGDLLEKSERCHSLKFRWGRGKKPPPPHLLQPKVSFPWTWSNPTTRKPLLPPKLLRPKLFSCSPTPITTQLRKLRQISQLQKRLRFNALRPYLVDREVYLLNHNSQRLPFRIILYSDLHLFFLRMNEHYTSWRYAIYNPKTNIIVDFYIYDNPCIRISMASKLPLHDLKSRLYHRFQFRQYKLTCRPSDCKSIKAIFAEIRQINGARLFSTSHGAIYFSLSGDFFAVEKYKVLWNGQQWLSKIYRVFQVLENFRDDGSRITTKCLFCHFQNPPIRLTRGNFQTYNCLFPMQET